MALEHLHFRTKLDQVNGTTRQGPWDFAITVWQAEHSTYGDPNKSQRPKFKPMSQLLVILQINITHGWQ
jgi:hypothetical protein